MQTTNIDWGKLYRQWRVKAIWVSRTEEEACFIAVHRFDQKIIKKLRWNHTVRSIEKYLADPKLLEKEQAIEESRKNRENWEELTIEDMREEYEELYKKVTPINKKNNFDWIQNKILEKKL